MVVVAEGDRGGLEGSEAEGRVARKRCEATSVVVMLRGLDMEAGRSGTELWGLHLRIVDWSSYCCDEHLLAHLEKCFGF